MPGKTRALTSALRLGMKYGPVAYQAARYGRGPAQAATAGSLGRAGTRRQALQHATSLVNGSALRVFHGDKQVWVVFTGDLPVATHPKMNVPISQLLLHADLSRRIYPRTGVPAPRALLESRTPPVQTSRARLASRFRGTAMRRPHLRVLPGRAGRDDVAERDDARREA